MSGPQFGPAHSPRHGPNPRIGDNCEKHAFFYAKPGVSSYILGSGVRILLVALPAQRFGASLRRGIVRFGGAADFGMKGEAGAISNFTAKNFLTMR